jgi:hypothetical protein
MLFIKSLNPVIRSADMCVEPLHQPSKLQINNFQKKIKMGLLRTFVDFSSTDIPTLMVCFNHATQKQTLDYLCIQPEEITNVFNMEL